MKLSIQTLIWTLVFLGLAVAITVAFIPKPIEVETALAAEGPLRVSIQEDGKTRIREKYTVSAPVVGRLSRIELEAGDEVCASDNLIAVILPAEPTMLDARSKAQAEARVKQANAAVQRAAVNSEQAKLNLELSEANFERIRKLRDTKAVSQTEFDIVRSVFLSRTQAIKTSQFDQEIAKYELNMAQTALMKFNTDDVDSATDPFKIFAPVAGRVLRVFQESSTVVNVGAPLMEIGDPSNLEIEVDVLSTDAVKIQPGSKLTIVHWGGESPLNATVRVIEPAAFTKISSLGVEEQRVNVIADFDEPVERIERLGDGYRVEANITIMEVSNVLSVPNSSLFRHQREWHVFVVVDGVARMKPVTTGVQNDTHTQIESGIAPNDEVILYPSDTVVAGCKVVKVNR